MTKKRAKADNLDAICREEKEKLDETDDQAKSAVSGVGGGPKYEGVPGYWQLDNENVILGRNNSRIVLGRDRPHSIFSGYGGRGDSHCASITLTAGGLGHYAKMCDDYKQPILAEPNFKNDAATIHMSQKTDIDMNFGLTRGKVGNPRTKSGIAIKADGIRIIGREGIKLVTLTDDENSQGGAQKTIPGIDLIAGNDDGDLQPLVKGHTLMETLENMRQSIQEVNGICTHLMAMNLSLETVLSLHVHPHGPVGPITGPSIECAVVGVANALQKMSLTLPSALSNKINVMIEYVDTQMRFLASRVVRNPVTGLPSGPILSKYNNTN